MSTLRRTAAADEFEKILQALDALSPEPGTFCWQACRTRSASPEPNLEPDGRRVEPVEPGDFKEFDIQNS